ncbi:MAG: N-acetylglucosamine-6-phosphate deacetylase [Paracoccaceae bacterium]
MTHFVVYKNGRFFDGTNVLDGHALALEYKRVAFFGPEDQAPRAGMTIDLEGDILFPGFVDLQINGGDGILLNTDPSVATIERIANAHRSLGVTALLPTLITDTLDKTRAAIAATKDAVRAGIPGIAGLHLEGPHLSVARKGAHDPALIRPMEAEDVSLLLKAAEALPLLKITVAPENVTEEQVQTLTRAGVLVSLGHTDANYETCRRYFAAGVRCVTHLFNAMSQLGNREPGLVGAALASGEAFAGLIADTVHVHPKSIRTAWNAKTGPGRIFLVSDAMAVAGSDMTEFKLGDRLIKRQDGVLTLSDGTLAGADLDLATAVHTMVQKVGVDLSSALQMATSVPASLIGLDYGFGSTFGPFRLRSDLSGVRQNQQRLGLERSA